MKCLDKIFLACLPVMAIAACGGGDTADRLDLADPTVRFVQSSSLLPSATLYRGLVGQPDATDVSYGFASNYFDVGIGLADWSVKTSVGGVTVGAVSIDPQRGNKYTIVALPESGAGSGVALIVDPYNKSLTSDSTRVRVMNASFNAASIDVYVNAAGTDIAAAGVLPSIAATAYRTAGPASGADSFDIPAGNYQLTITAAGSKTTLFRSQLSFGANKDILLLTVPASAAPGAIKTLEKVEGIAGTTELPAS
jgi:Domain of unknown function (DUF4397)